MNYLTAIKLVLTLLPYLIDAVKTVEKAFPETGSGAVKLGLVRANFPSGKFSAWYDDKTKEFQLCRNEAGPWKLINQGRVCYLYSKDIYEVVGGERTFHVRQLKPGVLLLSPRLGTK
jgi:hypothetical protein